jgi:TolA-binding protein
MKKQLLFILLFICFTSPAFSQQSQIYLDPALRYKEGQELFIEKNFLSAREKFEAAKSKTAKTGQAPDELLAQNLDFYIAVCAVEGNDKDAEQLLKRYIVDHHETDKRKQIYFYLGKYYYNNKKYSEALDQLVKVNVNDLDNIQIYEYKFMLGYAYFTKKKFTEAKPLFASLTGIKDKYYYPSNYYYAFISFYNKDYNAALKSFTEIEDSKMYSSVIPYYIAQIYYFKKDYDKLIPYIKKNLGRSDVLYQPELKFLLGQTYFQKSEFEKALPLLDEYITKSGKSKKEDLYQLAYCQYKTENYNKAITNFLQINLLDEPIGQSAGYALADCYLKTNQKEKSRAAFQSVSNMKHDETLRQNALYNYGKISFELGYLTEAIQSFENYLLLYDNGTYVEDVNEMFAAALVQTKNYERAYRIMEKLKLNSLLIKSAYQKVTYFRAIELFNDNQLEEAFTLCNKSLTNNLEPEITALATYLKAEILFKQNEFAASAEVFKKFSQLSNSTIDAKGIASKFRALYNIGYCSFKQKQYSAATIYFAEAIKDASTTADTKGKTSLLPDLYLRYADCSFVTKNYVKAIDAYSTIVEKNWSSAEYAQFQKAICLGLTNNSTDKISTLNNLVAKYPTSNYIDKAYFEIGETHLENNNLSAARSAFQTIINKFPSSALLPRSYIQTAVIDYNSGKKESAIETYKLMVKKYPDTKEAKESMEALKEIYVELGRADDYFAFAKSNSNITISRSEEDSLTYQSALNALNNGDCKRAVEVLNTYTEKFNSGYFIQDAHWKKSECLIQSKEFTLALVEFEALIKNKYGKHYEKSLLKASGIAYYELKDYAKAEQFFSLLYLASSSQANTYTAMIGMFNTASRLGQSEKVIEYADQILNSGIAKQEDIQIANFEKGKAYYKLGDRTFAKGAFNRVAEFPVNERCVESKYMVAKILYEEANYKASLDTCFRLKNKYSSYEEWIVKTFILISDNYAAQGNSFQARATLESIVTNYEGNQVLLNEAKEKLERIRQEELNKSKLMLIPPSDTLIMESDTLIKQE